MQENALLFLGYFRGIASKSGSYGLYLEEWQELVQMACDCLKDTPYAGEPQWLKEEKEKKIKNEAKIEKPPTEVEIE